MFPFLLHDVRILDYLPGASIWEIRATSQDFEKASLRRLLKPVVLEDVDFPLGQAHLDQIAQVKSFMARRGVVWQARLDLGPGTFFLSEPFELCSCFLRGHETHLCGEIKVRGTCHLWGCKVSSILPQTAPAHCRTLLKVGIRVLPKASLSLKNVSIEKIRGHGLFVSRDAFVFAEQTSILQSLVCNVYLARRAKLHLQRCTVEGNCWGIYFVDQSSLRMKFSKLSGNPAIHGRPQHITSDTSVLLV